MPHYEEMGVTVCVEEIEKAKITADLHALGVHVEWRVAGANEYLLFLPYTMLRSTQQKASML